MVPFGIGGCLNDRLDFLVEELSGERSQCSNRLRLVLVDGGVGRVIVFQVLHLGDYFAEMDISIISCLK